jgi:8-oxo-dGTP pyrophosphatase MutT (NUDIX family)
VTPSALRVRLAAIGAKSPEGSPVHGDDVDGDMTKPLVPAAVLVPVIISDTPSILLTKRTSHLSAHAGQVSFPGGRIDPEDSGPEAAALREAWEEIGLEATSVQVLGRMSDQITGTGYKITPILGLLPPGLTFQLSAHEVEAVFELPISVLLDPNAPKLQRQHVRGVWREYWVWPHPKHYIWGATAAILVRLAELLREKSV